MDLTGRLIWHRLRNYLRGWTDAELESARTKVSTRRIEALLTLTDREWRAFLKKGHRDRTYSDAKTDET